MARDSLADVDDAEADRMIRQLLTRPARPAQLTHKPDKLATCTSCRGVLNEQTGECKCSD
jgi:hypothetical protein